MYFDLTSGLLEFYAVGVGWVLLGGCCLLLIVLVVYFNAMFVLFAELFNCMYYAV